MLLTVPYDILYLILQQVPPKGLLILAQTCSYFNNQINHRETRNIWKYLWHRDYTSREPPRNYRDDYLDNTELFDGCSRWQVVYRGFEVLLEKQLRGGVSIDIDQWLFQEAIIHEQLHIIEQFILRRGPDLNIKRGLEIAVNNQRHGAIRILLSHLPPNVGFSYTYFLTLITISNDDLISLRMLSYDVKLCKILMMEAVIEKAVSCFFYLAPTLPKEDWLEILDLVNKYQFDVDVTTLGVF